MNNNGKIVGFVLAGLVLLPGCVPIPRYTKTSLKVIDDYTYRLMQNNIVLQSKKLNKAAQYMLFGDRIQKLADYEVICFSIHNLGGYSYEISSHSIGIPQVHSRDVAALLKTNTATSVGYMFAGFGGAAVGTGTSILCSPALMVISLVHLKPIPVVTTILFGNFLIGATLATVGFIGGFAMMGKSIKSCVMNRRMHNDLGEKIVDKAVVIESGDKYEGLIFVRAADYRPDFTVTLPEKDNPTHTLSFDVDLDTF